MWTIAICDWDGPVMAVPEEKSQLLVDECPLCGAPVKVVKQEDPPEWLRMPEEENFDG